MNRKWTALMAAVALLVGAAPAGVAATADAKAKPVPSVSPAREKVPVAKIGATPKNNLINLNAASRKELKGLPGGSDEEAARIIAGRPYKSKAFLVTDNVISAGRYEVIKKLVAAGESPKSAVPKK